LRQFHQKCLELYLENLSRLNRSSDTLRSYRSDLIGFIAWYETTHYFSIARAKARDIENYLAWLSGTGVKAKIPSGFITTIFAKFFAKITYRSGRIPCSSQRSLSTAGKRRHLSCIKNFFEFLKEYHQDHLINYFSKSPIRPRIHRIKFKDGDTTHTQLLSRSDWQKIDEYITKTPDRLFVYLLYYAGLRLNEARVLKFDQFDVTSGTLEFVRKGGKRQILFFESKETSDKIIRQYLFLLNQKKNLHAYIFSKDGITPYGLRAMASKMEKLIRRSGADSKITPHSFRKACATNLYLKYRDLLFVRDYLGHSDAKVTQTYIDIKITKNAPTPITFEDKVSHIPHSVSQTHDLWLN